MMANGGPMRRFVFIALGSVAGVFAATLLALANRPLVVYDFAAERAWVETLRGPRALSDVDKLTTGAFETWRYWISPRGGAPQTFIVRKNYAALAAELRQQGYKTCILTKAWIDDLRNCPPGIFMFVDSFGLPERLRRLWTPGKCIIGTPINQERLEPETLISFAPALERFGGQRFHGKLAAFGSTWAVDSTNIVYLVDDRLMVRGAFCHLSDGSSLEAARTVAARCATAVKRPLPTMPFPGWGAYADCRLGRPGGRRPNSEFAPTVLDLLRVD